MYIWAIDGSLSNTGICIFDREGKIIYVCSISTSGKVDLQYRLRNIGDELERLQDEYPCDVLVMENGFMRFHRATQLLYQLRGIIVYIFSTCKQIFYAPTTIKKVVTGSGKSDKKVVMSYIKERYPEIEFNNDDQSDACAAGLTYFIKEVWHGEN